jgi:hypothetical protein
MARKANWNMRIGLALGFFLASSYFGHNAIHAFTTSVAPSTSANERLANQMAAGRGWGPGQQQCLDSLWTEESGFSSTALNSQSGATGIPQLLPSVHQIPPNWSDPRVQIRWGLDYIAGKYGTPCDAWAFETSHTPNWY